MNLNFFSVHLSTFCDEKYFTNGCEIDSDPEYR